MCTRDTKIAISFSRMNRLSRRKLAWIIFIFDRHLDPCELRRGRRATRATGAGRGTSAARCASAAAEAGATSMVDGSWPTQLLSEVLSILIITYAQLRYDASRVNKFEITNSIGEGILYDGEDSNVFFFFFLRAIQTSFVN